MARCVPAQRAPRSRSCSRTRSGAGSGRSSGILVEYDATQKIFTTPADRRTEDYVTGRFG
jgi:ABC-type phosphate transport system ATPase subunit